jgi:signal recognition particle subunit SRP54
VFENLTERLNNVFTELRRRGKLSAADVDMAMREVRLALLEADVNYGVVKDFIARVRERSVGAEVSKALNPAQMVIKIVNEELINTLGEPDRLNMTGARPCSIVLAGLQGSGKTTMAGKLARLLRSQGERVMLVAADPYRPAAVKQLETLGEKLNVPVYFEAGVKPPDLVSHALDKAGRGGETVVILDTAGRSQLDNELMDELTAIDKKIHPVETLLVVDSMIGQEAVNIAKGFRQAIPLTGLILTKMDGDARGGAAISIRSVTGVPIKFLGTGEALDALEVYDPGRLASRILGMGDMLTFIEKAEKAFDQKKAEELQKKMEKATFDLEDFLGNLKEVRKMGSIAQLASMIPGLSKVASKISEDDQEKQLKKVEAIVLSMTPLERHNPNLIDGSRRRRIAAGSGTQIQDINQLLNQFRQMQKLMKMGMKGKMPRNMMQMFK